MSNWAEEVDKEDPPRTESPGNHKRHGSLERYRPGAIRGQGQSRGGHKGRGQGERREQRHNKGAGSDPEGPAVDLRNKLNANKKLDSHDLRHRLNQRSREPEPPKEEERPGSQPHRQKEPQQPHKLPQQPQGRNGSGRGNSSRNRHQRVQGRGDNFGSGGSGPRPHPQENGQAPAQPRQSAQLPRPKRNTENFNPSYAPAEMRILAAQPGLKKYNRDYTSRDVLVVNGLFCGENDLTIYNDLLHEMDNSGIHPDQLWQSWHGDSHLIADDKRRWKDDCPTFHMILDKIRDYFEMDIKATRLNLYRDSTEWKPFHHDAAAIKPNMAKIQNMTVAVSFGMERDVAFEHAQTKTVISMPQPNGTIYTFGKDVNILWRHGIPQIPPENNIILTHNGPGYRIKFKGQNLQTNTHGVRYNSFRGIPYAQPPVGDLRFRDPKPIEYEGIAYVNATTYSMPCSQIDLTKTDELKIFGHEDCLTLDIHTPTTCTDTSCPLKPVMVFLHGGSFSMGTGSHYGPELFMDQRNVVLITLNYRLSALGFLSLENWQLSGNQGLKDQLEALKWINGHIRTFGGDRSKITVFGHASGAQSVHAHLLSRLGHGLFQGAILQSGSMPLLVHQMQAKQTEQSSRSLLKLLDCSRQYMQDVLNCLQNRNLEDIFVHLMPKSNIMDALTAAQRENEAPALMFGPVVDDYALVPFLPESPWNIMMEQRFKRVPIMMGACKDEGTLYVPSLWNRITEANNLWNDIAAKIFLGKAGKSLSDKETTVLNVLKNFYLDNDYTSMEMKQDLLDIISDGLTLSPMHETAHSFVSANIPVYFYELTHRPSFSYSQLYGAPFGTRDIDFGVSHGDDLLLMFNVSFLRTINPIETEGDVKVSNYLLKLWTNFAEFGNPTPTSSDAFPLWKPFKRDQEHVYEIGDQLILDDQARFHDRMFLWRNVFWNTLFNRTSFDTPIQIKPFMPPPTGSNDHHQGHQREAMTNSNLGSPNEFPSPPQTGLTPVQATPPPYLALDGFRECLGRTQEGTVQSYCKPLSRPTMCPMETWYRLQSTFQGETCDERVMMTPPNSASYGPPSYMSLPYSENCFEKVNSGTTVTRCLPQSRPHGCPYKTWETIKRTFPGKNCRDVPRDSTQIEQHHDPPIRGTTTTPKPQNLEYLMVSGLDRCMGMRSDNGKIYHCLPFTKPEYCDFESWNKLMKTFEGPRCDGSKRVPAIIQGEGVPKYLSIEGHKDCLGSIRRNGANGGFAPCMPQVKPTFCVEDTWRQLQRHFDGQRCERSNSGIPLDPQAYEDCLGSYRTGFQGWDLCIPRKRPKFCSDAAWIKLQFESDKDVCPHQADTMNFDYISCQSDIECPIHRRKCFNSQVLRISGVCVPKRCEGDIDCPRIGGNAGGTFVAGYCRNQYGICHYDRIIESK
eukprot:maker-scaffold203_size261420-snap-gene-0.13 protein:Tk10406 transcript:maker-scaffold203_size261420-snap-gene-0.13-mRNA-1 annotation:"PREDICTED: uncharacterized protein LOC100207802"